MDSAIKLPIDLVQLPNFRQLRDLLAADGLERPSERALFLWWTLWQELAYRAQEGTPPGRLPRSEVPMFLAALEAIEPDQSKRQRLLEHCVAARLLRADGEDYFCPRFALLHGDFGQSRSQAQRGGDMKAFHQRMKSADGAAFQQSLLIHEAKLVDGEGQPLPHEEVKRVTRLIVACDNALFRAARPPYGFTEGLIQDALSVLKRFTDEEINAVCCLLARHRNHPALSGLTTEKLLPRFGEIAGHLDHE